MKPLRASFFYAFAIALSAFGSAGILRLTESFSVEVHMILLLSLALIFSFSEIYFRNLVSEINSVLRWNGFSQVESEKLREVLRPARRTADKLWGSTLFCKALAVVAGAAVKANISETSKQVWLHLGYTAILISLFTLVWSYVNFCRIEAFRDKLAEEEIQKRERSRLLGELIAGSAHDFDKDLEMKGYTNSAGS